MRFPLALTTKIAAYIIGKNFAGRRNSRPFCSLSRCTPAILRAPAADGFANIPLRSRTSCRWRIASRPPRNATRRWSRSAAASRSSIRRSRRWSSGLLEQRRIVYVCTNAMFMRKKMREWLAAEFPQAAGCSLRSKDRTSLLAEELITAKDAEASAKGRRTRPSSTIAPSRGCIGTSISTASSGRTI